LVRYWADFFLSPGGLSVPVGVLGRFEAAVSARKNPVPGGLAFALAKERREKRTIRFSEPDVYRDPTFDDRSISPSRSY
jgi:hypothetical protein